MYESSVTEKIFRSNCIGMMIWYYLSFDNVNKEMLACLILAGIFENMSGLASFFLNAKKMLQIKKMYSNIGRLNKITREMFLEKFRLTLYYYQIIY